MKRKKIIFPVIVVAVVTMGWYGYSEYNRGNTDLSTIKADAALSAAGIVKAFETNEQEANSSYLGKIILINGTVKNIDIDERGYYTVVLGDKNTMSSVRCSIDSLHITEVFLLKAGDIAKIKGSCIGFNPDELLGSDVILNRCVIENNQEKKDL